MRILWIKTELLHPVDKGGKIRTYQMLRALRARHDITYLCLDDGSAAPNALADAGEYATRVVTVPFHPPARGGPGYFVALFGNLFSRLPYAAHRYCSKELRRRIEELSTEADLLVCDFLAPSANVPDAIARKTVLFQHNVEAMIWQRHAAVPQHALRKAYMSLQARRMLRFESAHCRRYARVIAVSEADAEVFRTSYGVRRVSAVSTGVDLQFFAPNPTVARNPDELVFVGSMDWMPNEDGIRWFAAEVFPAIRARRPAARLTVVGRSPSPALRKLAETTDGISLTGTVDDVRPYVARAALSIVPLRIGGGTRLKIYESMAMGTPVVSTTIGAEGLPLQPGRHLVIADAAPALADAVCGVLADPARARAMADASLEFVRANCGWDSVADEFLAACTQ